MFLHFPIFKESSKLPKRITFFYCRREIVEFVATKDSYFLEIAVLIIAPATFGCCFREPFISLGFSYVFLLSKLLKICKSEYVFFLSWLFT